MRAVCRAYINFVKSQLITDLHKRFGIFNSEDVIKFVEKKKEMFGFSFVLSLINFKEGNEQEKSFKKAFVVFQRVYFRRWYCI